MRSRVKHGIEILLLLSGLALAAQQPLTPASGSVQGVLIDEAGKPVKDFSITILGASPSSTNHVEAQTDEQGNFSVKGLELGSYTAAPHLDTEDSHYPPGTGAFFNKHLVRFLLSQSSSQATLSITLDPPCLILSGVVTNRDSEQPVFATISMWHKDDPDKWVRSGSSTKGKYRLWLPPGEIIVMEVSAPGYLTYRKEIPAIKDGVDPVIDIVMAPTEANHK